MKKDNIKNVSSGTITNFSGALAGKICVFIFTYILARKLPSDEVGIYFLTVSIVTILSSIAILGLEPALVRYISITDYEENSDQYSGVIASAFIIAAFMCVMVIALTHAFKPMIVSIYKDPQIEETVALLSFAIPFDVFRRLVLSVTRGLKDMRYTAWIEDFAVVLLRLSVAWSLLTFTDFELTGVLIAYLSSSIAGLFISAYTAKKFLNLSSGTWHNLCFKEMLSFSLPMALTSMMFNFLREFDNLLIGWLGTVNMVGIYSIITRLLNSFKFIFLAFQRAIAPHISALKNAGKYAELRELVTSAQKWNLILNIPICLFLTAFPAFFLSLFGKEYIVGYGSLALLAATSILSSISGLSSSLIFMSGKSGKSFAINLLWLTLVVGLDILLIPKLGILGAAISGSICIVLIASIRVWISIYHIGINPLDSCYLKPVLAGVASFLCTVAVFGWNSMIDINRLFLSSSMFTSIYFLLVVIIVLNKEEMLSVKRKIMQLGISNR